MRTPVAVTRQNTETAGVEHMKYPSPKQKKLVNEVTVMEAPASAITIAILFWTEIRGSNSRQAPIIRKSSSTPTERTRNGMVEVTGLKGTPM